MSHRLAHLNGHAMIYAAEAASTAALAGRDLLSIASLTESAVDAIFETAHDVKADILPFRNALAGKAVMLLFEKPSLRTRVSFEVGVAKLGGSAVYMDHSAQRLGVREPVADYGRNLERWTEAIVARTFSHHTVEALAQSASIPVINGLSDLEHPCQALADFFTLKEKFGSLKGLRMAYVGDGNNVCNSLILLAAKLGVDLMVVTPPGYEPFPAVVSLATILSRRTGANVMITDEVEAVYERQAVYTDTWVSMGQDGEAERRKADFAPYQVNKALMEIAGKDALFMHCLPAHRGEEVSSDVIDSKQSVVYDQAENRMHVQNAVLLHLLNALP